ncbi:MAG: FAD:protein FMN transferase [Verrucomicrobiota bacterium]
MSEPYKFDHDAMKTTYTLRLVSDQKLYAQNLAYDLFGKIDELEAKLSRYAHGSDIWQINHMKAGDQLFISEETNECLRLAFEAHQITNGLFDITLGAEIEHQKNANSGKINAGQGQLMLDPEKPLIYCEVPGRELDLGGIGKGYTLDYLLRQIDGSEGIEGGLLSAGTSTQLAFGEQPWDITLNGEENSVKVTIQNEALSASGTSIQGEHIISPTGESRQNNYRRVWIVHDKAAIADALSTAALLLPEAENAELLAQTRAVYSEDSRNKVISQLVRPLS